MAKKRIWPESATSTNRGLRSSKQEEDKLFDPAGQSVFTLLVSTSVLAYKGLSRMRGNSPVRFLGEGQAVMLVPYPTLSYVIVFQRKTRLVPGFLFMGIAGFCVELHPESYTS